MARHELMPDGTYKLVYYSGESIRCLHAYYDLIQLAQELRDVLKLVNNTSEFMFMGDNYDSVQLYERTVFGSSIGSWQPLAFTYDKRQRPWINLNTGREMVHGQLMEWCKKAIELSKHELKFHSDNLVDKLQADLDEVEND